MTVPSTPQGYHTATPYLIVRDGAAAIDFYRRAFGATELTRMVGEDKVVHAEIRIGDSVVMLADEFPDLGFSSPETLGGSPVSILLYFENVDAQFAQALAAGARAVRPVQDQFYGDRSGTVIDPFGHTWTLATHVEDVSPEEMERRLEESRRQQSGA